jgi:hypothetical protein
MHDTAPRLIGPPRHVLELEPVSYQYHIAGTILHAPITNDWDANWLNVRMLASDGRRHWTSTEPALLTWDLHRLINWLRAAADAELWTQPMDIYSGLEPSLQFEARVNKTTKIRALFTDQFAPPTGRPWIDFIPGPTALQRFADALEHTSASFPIRVVEASGPALHYRGQLTSGATRWKTP